MVYNYRCLRLDDKGAYCLYIWATPPLPPYLKPFPLYCAHFHTLGYKNFMKTFKKECAICGSWFSASSNSAKYCSDACREQGAREHQRDLMRRKRKEIRDEKQSRVVRLPNKYEVKNSAEMMKNHVEPQITLTS